MANANGCRSRWRDSQLGLIRRLPFGCRNFSITMIHFLIEDFCRAMRTLDLHFCVTVFVLNVLLEVEDFGCAMGTLDLHFCITVFVVNVLLEIGDFGWTMRALNFHFATVRITFVMPKMRDSRWAFRTLDLFFTS